MPKAQNLPLDAAKWTGISTSRPFEGAHTRQSGALLEYGDICILRIVLQNVTKSLRNRKTSQASFSLASDELAQ